MDANVLRAAVSAALRVTVSTTLIGCGGSVMSDADGSGSASKGTAGRGGSTDAAQSAGGQRAAPTPVLVGPPASAGQTSSATAGSATVGSATAGVATGGTGGTPTATEVGGVPNAAGAGQAGEPASAGAPAAICGEAVDACLTLLEPEASGPTLSDAGKACCDTVIVGLDELRLGSAECFGDLNRRFMSSGVRGLCCADQATWSHLACTPWGPPVPPELSAEALRAWSLAA